MRKIETLDDLRSVRKDLALRQKVTREELKSKLGYIQSDAGGFMLKKMILPVGLGLVASLVIKHLVAPKTSVRGHRKEQLLSFLDNVQANQENWMAYAKIFLSVLKLFQGKRSTVPFVENGVSGKVEKTPTVMY